MPNTIDFLRRTGGRRPELTGNTAVVLVTVFIVAFGNLAFFSNVLKAYPPVAGKLPELAGLVFLLAVATMMLPALLCFGRATKPLLIAPLLLSSVAAYFMDSYGVVINAEMLQNAAQTNPAEARDLLTFRMLAYVALLGVVPTILLTRAKLSWRGWRTEVLARLRLLSFAVAMAVALLLIFGGFFASFAREHKSLRSYANPTYPLYGLVKYAKGQGVAATPAKLVAIGTDAAIPVADKHRELIILVVGETARADHFGLNGYARETTPFLRQAGVVNFGDFHACGTSTAVSVPCMFSLSASAGGGEDRENILDVLQHAGANVLWLDNNSDSKGVALRVPYRDYRSPENNTICDVECRDEGMLVPLQDYIDAHPSGDIFIVLHQMGSHGPAYYKRYPPAFDRFQPACQSNDLSRCSQAEVINAYDNSLLYTDYFLAKTIDVLKKNDGKFETALFYVSDHGESLGESGVYLHGLPKALAPEAQLHVPAIMWFGAGFKELDRACLLKKQDRRFTHDHLFHTLLGFLEISTSIYRLEMDILDGCRRPEQDDH